jgi:hypothetical protein
VTFLGTLEVGPQGLGCMGMSQSYGEGDVELCIGSFMV